MLLNWNINWSSLLVVGALGVLGLWVAYSFLNKNGLFLFSVLAIVLSTCLMPALIYESMPTAIVLLPLVFFAILISYEKYGKDDAQRLFYVSLITIGVLFIFTFFQAAYLDAAFNMQNFLTWKHLGGYISLAVSFAGAVIGAYYINEKMSWKKFSKYFRRSMIISIASAINCFLFIILSNIGVLSFGSMILLFLIALLITVSVSFAVAYLAKYMNRKSIIEIAPADPAGENGNKTTVEKEKESKEEDKDKK